MERLSLMVLTKRMIADVVVLAVLVGGYTLVHVITDMSVSASRVTGHYFSVAWIIMMALVTSLRAIVGLRIASARRLAQLGTIEWFMLAVVANLLLAGLDVWWHPEYNLKTVLAFGLFPVILPSVITSTIVYFLVSRMTAK